LEAPAENLWHSFFDKAGAFVESTEALVQEGVNPGGYYQAVWCRDASYILKDWFLSGRFEDTMHEMLFIWSHQISEGGEPVIYGRGSPEMQYISEVASHDKQKSFAGALPTTIFHGFSEVYGQKPDIDSTALMISSTAWIFDAYLKSGMMIPASSASAHGGSQLRMSPVVSSPSVVMDFVVPKMLRAAEYLAGRDVDGDTRERIGELVAALARWATRLKQMQLAAA
jgi:hypothetical protein